MMIKRFTLVKRRNEYPFAGYKKILNTIYNEVMQFDIGFGTGILTSKLYEKGHHIDGIDFSTDGSNRQNENANWFTAICS